jgi:Arc/MetJ-type ribon-helix-helix transcriptional regulator
VYELSEEIKTLVDERLATGKYASEDEILLLALQRLREYDDTVSDVQEGMEDEAAGRLRPLHEADAEIRRNLGFSK